MNADIAGMLYIGAIGLVAIGGYGLMRARHLFRMVLALAIAEAGANLFLVLAGFRWQAVAPIYMQGAGSAAMVDPVPQAMVLTAIVIGVGVQAFAVALVVRAYRRYGTLDVSALHRHLLSDIAKEADIAPSASQDAPGAAPGHGVRV